MNVIGKKPLSVLAVALGLARHDLVNVAQLSREVQLSISHVEKMCQVLKRANLVSARRGVGGGYCLARAPAQITVAEVMGAYPADPIDPSTHGPPFERLRADVADFLGGITLAALISR